MKFGDLIFLQIQNIAMLSSSPITCIIKIYFKIYLKHIKNTQMYIFCLVKLGWYQYFDTCFFVILKANI